MKKQTLSKAIFDELKWNLKWIQIAWMGFIARRTYLMMFVVMMDMFARLSTTFLERSWSWSGLRFSMSQRAKHGHEKHHYSQQIRKLLQKYREISIHEKQYMFSYFLTMLLLILWASDWREVENCMIRYFNSVAYIPKKWS